MWQRKKLYILYTEETASKLQAQHRCFQTFMTTHSRPVLSLVELCDICVLDPGDPHTRRLSVSCPPGGQCDLDLFIMVNCKTLHVWSICQIHPGLGSVLVVGTPVILNSYLVLTFAGHVQVQREKNHCPREAWDTKLCKKNKKQKKQTSQSIHPSIKQKFQSLFKLDS